MRPKPHVFLRPMSGFSRPCTPGLRAPRFPALTMLVALAVLVTASPVRAAVTTTVIETFDGTLPDATWRLDNFSIPGLPMTDEIVDLGGHPGAFLRNPVLTSVGPTIRYIAPPDGPFLGDYRVAGVVSLGIVLPLFYAECGLYASWW